MSDIQTFDGYTINFEDAVNLMNHEIREKLYSDVFNAEINIGGNLTTLEAELKNNPHEYSFEQAFYDEYCRAHYKKFGEKFIVN